jgi:hypothetical protein
MSVPERKQTYVDPQVQGTLVRRLILHWLGFFITASLVTFVLQVLSNPLIPISAHFEELWWTQGPFLLVMIFLLPMFVLDTIKLSNRFVGPIYRLRRTIQDVAAGGVPRKLKFRDFDFWQVLADDYNKMLDRLASKPTSVVLEAEDLEELAAN